MNKPISTLKSKLYNSFQNVSQINKIIGLGRIHGNKN